MNFSPLASPVVELGDLVEIRSSLADPLQSDKSILPHVGPEHIRSGSGNIDWRSVKSCAEDGVTSGKYEFQPGDIIYSKIRPYLNKVAIADRVGLCSADMYAIETKTTCDSQYIYRYLQTPDFLAYAASFSGRANIPKLNRQQLLRGLVPLPPLDEQRRIAAILDKADALRRKRKRIAELIRSVPQSLFMHMFDDPQANPGRWNRMSALSDVAIIGSGITKGRKEPSMPVRPVPYLAVSNVQDRTLDLSTVKTIEASEDEIARFRLKSGDLVLTEGGDPDKLGRGTVWRDELPEAIHQNHIFRVRVDPDELDPLYLNFLIGSGYGKSYFLRSAKQTTGIASINKAQLSRFPVLLPPLDLQRKFASEIDRLAMAQTRASEADMRIANLFNSLQHRAFSGQL